MYIYIRHIERLFLGYEESAGRGDNMERRVLVKIKSIEIVWTEVWKCSFSQQQT